jgi:hypothetical protein
MEEWRTYFSPAMADANGLYFEDTRHINNDNALDVSIDISILDDIENLAEGGETDKAQEIIEEWFYKEKMRGE